MFRISALSFCLLFVSCGSDSNSNSSESFTIVANPKANDSGMSYFTKYVEVLGLSIYAESDVPDERVLYAAHILAELLDNDENGEVDDQALIAELLRQDALVPMFNNEGSPAENDFFENYQGDGLAAVLYSPEVDPSQPGHWGSDATIEEIMHTINAVGHRVVYPEAFGIEPNSSLLTAAMDVARGGQHTSHPGAYPDDAWYHYDDTTCDYGCMAIEYIYWAQVSNMGILDDSQTCAGIANEWQPCTRALLESMDTLMYALITDPQYKLPQLAPDGKYAPAQTEK